MTDEEMEKSFRIASGWCVIFFVLLAISGFMGWQKAYVVLQIPCAGWCLIGLLVYALWIALYGLRRLRG